MRKTFYPRETKKDGAAAPSGGISRHFVQNRFTRRICLTATIFWSHIAPEFVTVFSVKKHLTVRCTRNQKTLKSHDKHSTEGSILHRRVDEYIWVHRSFHHSRFEWLATKRRKQSRDGESPMSAQGERNEVAPLQQSSVCFTVIGLDFATDNVLGFTSDKGCLKIIRKVRHPSRNVLPVDWTPPVTWICSARICLPNFSDRDQDKIKTQNKQKKMTSISFKKIFLVCLQQKQILLPYFPH